MFKNVVIISIDSLRADGINYNRDLIYGKGNHKPIKTPNLDKFAREGTSFINAYSTNTYTTSAHASLFTGEYPPVHGIRAFFDFNQKLNPKVKTIAEELNEKGFQTFFYSDVPNLFSEMNIWRGFKVKTYERTDWLWSSIEEFKRNRNFVFIHLFDIHSPYLFVEDKSESIKINKDFIRQKKLLLKKFKLKVKKKEDNHTTWRRFCIFITKHYLNERRIMEPISIKGIEKFDKLRFPKFLNNLKRLGFNKTNTLFIILSDHGEGEASFKSKNFFSHAWELTESVLRILMLTNYKFNRKVIKKKISIKDIKNIILEILKGEINLKLNDNFIYAEYFKSNLNYLKKSTNFASKEFENLCERSSQYLIQNALLINNLKLIFNNFKSILKDPLSKFNTWNRAIVETYLTKRLEDIEIESEFAQGIFKNSQFLNQLIREQIPKHHIEIETLKKKNNELKEKLFKIYTSKTWKLLAFYKKATIYFKKFLDWK